MANTVSAPVSNSIALAQNYLPLLDEVYKRGALSAILDTDNSRVEWAGADTVRIMSLQTVGMGSYSRNAGYVPGNLTGTWETYKIELDRGRSYLLDYLDNEEAQNILAAQTLNEVERVQVIPEIDAYTFAKLAGTSGISAGTAAAITVGTTDVPALIQTAEQQMDDDEVPYEGRILFVSPKTYSALKAKIERRIINSENNVNTNVEFYDDMQIIRVPQSRFYTAITLNAASAASDAGGYVKDATDGKDINFMIVHPSAVLKVMKHYVPRTFSPEQVYTADAFIMNMRYAADAFVLDNKKKGIYLHASTT